MSDRSVAPRPRAGSFTALRVKRTVATLVVLAAAAVAIDYGAAALTEDIIRKEMTLMKEMGVNFIRLGHYQQSRIARLGSAEPPNYDLGRAWQPRHRIKISRIDEQGRCYQLVQRPPRCPARGNGAKVAGQAPPGIKRHSVSCNFLAPQKRFESRQRRVHMHFVDHGDE